MNILVVEDEALIAFWLGSLVEQAGHRLIGTCKRLEDAQRIAEGGAPEMAFIDLRLGNRRCGAAIDGYLAETYGTTSIYVTANRSFALAYRRRAIGFIEKPIAGGDVLEAIAFVDQLRGGRSAAVPPRLTLFKTRDVDPAIAKRSVSQTD
jgi:DNA-binding NtrC family response regulator